MVDRNIKINQRINYQQHNKLADILTSGIRREYGQADAKREIFQGDPLSPLLFAVIMLPLTSTEKDESRIQKHEEHYSTIFYFWMI